MGLTGHLEVLLWMGLWAYVKSWHITGILALQPEPLRALLLQVLDSRPSDLREEPVPIASSSGCRFGGDAQPLPAVP